ncbi:FtsX-like permease family protein [Microtetraspora fusca]|uniref:FtsX-like permease family protein n=1 Tax=Microtetraspora fusca TaxID=1997 RepID=UPI0008340DA6|nr:ABC transporter permease [Microtetraspora fusca]
MNGVAALVGVAWLTLRSRVSGFAGAIVALALGVGYSGAAVSLLATASALPPGTPAPLRRAVQESGSLLVMLAVIGAFATIFVVAGTFAFTVAQRRRELAVLRAVGATPGQVRGLVMAEAWLAAVMASVIGTVLAFPLTAGVTAALRGQGLLPAGFVSRVSPGALFGAFVPGVVIGVVAAASAARRASQVRPAEALRDAALAEPPIGRGRWGGGLAFLACGAGMLALVPVAPPDGRMPLTMFVSLPLVLGFALLAPAFAAWVGAAVATPLVRLTSATGMLARENVRQAVRRTASTAAPVLVTVGLTGSLLGGTALLGRAIAADAQRSWRSDLVVSGPGAAEVAAVPGVRVAVPVTAGEVEVSANRTERTVAALGVLPEGIGQVMNVSHVAGDLAGLRHRGVAADRRQAEGFGWRLGGPVRLALPGREPAVLRLAAVFDGSPLGGPLLVPQDLLPGPVSVHVAVGPGGDPRAVAAAIERRSDRVRVTPTAETTAAAGKARQEGMRIGAVALTGFAVAYTLISVANTSAMAFGSRRSEFARLLRIGARRAQVLRMVLWESLCVAATGALLGVAVTALAVLGLREVLRGIGSAVPAALPWAETGAVVGACVAVVTLSSLVPAAVALRGRHDASSRR